MTKKEQVKNKLNKYNYKMSEKEFDKWYKKLNWFMINNFLSLDIEIDKINNIIDLIIDYKILCCYDYVKRVKELAFLNDYDANDLKNLKKSNFLICKDFYEFMNLLKKQRFNEYLITLFGSFNFIYSPYYLEDLKLILNIFDNPLKHERISYLVALACNKNSIYGKSHLYDMKLLVKCEISCINELFSEAINEQSIKDKNHMKKMYLIYIRNSLIHDFFNYASKTKIKKY